MKETIKRRFEESIQVKKAFLEENMDGIIQSVEILVETFRKDGKLLIFGNGGSAADAQHIAAELVNRMEIPGRAALPTIALTTDTSILTSVLNDLSSDEVFSRQIEALGRPGDVALAISTSGNSPNILKGLEACRDLGVKTIVMTGGDGGGAAEKADLVLRVRASTSAARIQETHITIGHVLCEMVEKALFGADGETGGLRRR